MDKMIYRGISYLWRNTLLKWYRNCKRRKEENYWSEHRIRKGKENPQKTFYVIRRRDVYCGLCSILLTSLQRISDAMKEGYVPVIDLQNNFNIYLPEDKIGKENAWDYYFRQPANYSLADIQHSQNIVLSSGAVPDMFPYLDIDFLYGKTGELEYWRSLAKKYFVLSDEARWRVQQEYERLFTQQDKILGVKCRGTDYVKGKPKNHPIQPTVEQMIEKVEEIFEKQNCTKIFLATEDKLIYDAFIEKFGNRILSNKTYYAEYMGGSAGREEYEREKDNYESGMEYLITTVLLSRCNCLCAGCVSGTVAALLLTEGYEYMYLFDLGIYG